ncbi:hypothetical protein C9374_007045 [Naegleria lovaniensis]|uniref:RGS domain-containing protein n=1 Tax=Naegleria lovaniensis TaxID=51637 RepID=A0AA88H4P1_NAELO|nr:uncharacterized protein C9374_007045 [Naegleria lovaniensis]KAG2393514.1 hypothetical protein C9374_007045 [Naegleria lovaniensis]
MSDTLSPRSSSYSSTASSHCHHHHHEPQEQPNTEDAHNESFHQPPTTTTSTGRPAHHSIQLQHLTVQLQEPHPNVRVSMSNLQLSNTSKNPIPEGRYTATAKNPTSEPTSKKSMKFPLFYRGVRRQIFVVNTCCGLVELNCLKLSCLIGMILTVVGLVVLAGFSISTFVVASQRNSETLIAVGQVYSYFEQANTLILRTIYQTALESNLSNDAGTNYKYSDIMKEYMSISKQLLDLMEAIVKSLGGKDMEIKFKYTQNAANAWDSLNSHLYLMLTFGQVNESVSRLQSSEYGNVKKNFQDGVTDLVNYVRGIEKGKDANLVVTTVIQLIVIVVSVLLLSPLIVMIFTYAINTDSKNTEKFRKANELMILDTIENPTTRNLFKLHCEQEDNLHNYYILEKIQHFKSLAEKCLEMESKKMSSVSAEQFAKFENEKFEVAFEIYALLEGDEDTPVAVPENLISNAKDVLDAYNLKQIEFLPFHMFSNIEKELCTIMLDCHHRFKHSLVNQKEMKLDKMKISELLNKNHADVF